MTRSLATHTIVDSKLWEMLRDPSTYQFLRVIDRTMSARMRIDSMEILGRSWYDEEYPGRPYFQLVGTCTGLVDGQSGDFYQYPEEDEVPMVVQYELTQEQEKSLIDLGLHSKEFLAPENIPSNIIGNTAEFDVKVNGFILYKINDQPLNVTVSYLDIANPCNIVTTRAECGYDLVREWTEPVLLREFEPESSKRVELENKFIPFFQDMDQKVMDHSQLTLEGDDVEPYVSVDTTEPVKSVEEQQADDVRAALSGWMQQRQMASAPVVQEQEAESAPIYGGPSNQIEEDGLDEPTGIFVANAQEEISEEPKPESDFDVEAGFDDFLFGSVDELDLESESPEDAYQAEVEKKQDDAKREAEKKKQLETEEAPADVLVADVGMDLFDDVFDTYEDMSSAQKAEVANQDRLQRESRTRAEVEKAAEDGLTQDELDDIGAELLSVHDQGAADKLVEVTAARAALAEINPAAADRIDLDEPKLSEIEVKTEKSAMELPLTPVHEDRFDRTVRLAAEEAEQDILSKAYELDEVSNLQGPSESLLAQYDDLEEEANDFVDFMTTFEDLDI